MLFVSGISPILEIFIGFFVLKYIMTKKQFCNGEKKGHHTQIRNAKKNVDAVKLLVKIKTETPVHLSPLYLYPPTHQKPQQQQHQEPVKPRETQRWGAIRLRKRCPWVNRMHQWRSTPLT